MSKSLSFAMLMLLCQSGCSSDPMAPPSSTPPRHVLFIGNSLTNSNGLAAMLQAVAQQVGDTTLAVVAVAVPDFSLSDHYRYGTTVDWFRRRRLSYVVLQQGPSALPDSQEHLRVWTQRFAPIIREAGAVPVLFMVWPTLTRVSDFPSVATAYRNAASAVDGIFAPAGAAWAAYAQLGVERDVSAITAYGDLYADGTHPTPLGSYLSAIVLLERMTGISPKSLPPVIPGVPAQPAVVIALQLAATQALAANPGRSIAQR